MSNTLVKNNQTANEQAFGVYGFNEITSSGATVTIASTDRFVMLIAKGETVCAFTNEAENGILSSASFPLEDGEQLYGFYKGLSVASGKLKVYYGKN